MTLMKTSSRRLTLVSLFALALLETAGAQNLKVRD